MIFRLTQKLARKLHEELTESVPLGSDPFSDWNAGLFRAGRAQYILLMNTRSLYSIVMHGVGITDHHTFLDRVILNIRDTMTEDGLLFFHRCVAPHCNSVIFSKTNGRSSTGSLNELIYHAMGYLIESQISPRDTSYRLNEMPMKAIGYRYPREAFLEQGCHPSR